MAPLIALLALQTPGTVTLGTYPFDGRDVPAIVSAAPGPIPAGPLVVDRDGEKFLLGGTGQYVRRFRFEGGWSEVRGGYAAAKAAMTPATPEWRVKIFVLPRTDILDLAANGVARVRRATMESGEIGHVAESAARFAAMVEASAMGKLRVRLDFEVDGDTAYQTARKGEPPFGSTFLAEYLSPRVNGGLYEAEDKVYRGPYDSIFVIHSGLCIGGATASAHGMPATGLSAYSDGLPQGPWALSIALYNGWVHHLAITARKAGWRVPDDLIHPIAATPGEVAQGYSGLLDWESLPLEPHRDDPPADTLSAHAAAAPLARRAWPTPGPGSIGATLIVPSRGDQDVAAALEPNGDTAKLVPVRRGMTVKDAQDGERGDVLELRVGGLVRTGDVLLLGQRNGPALADASVHPYLSFFIKSVNPEPMVLRLVQTNGQPDRLVRIFGSWPMPAELETETHEAALAPSGPGWSSIVLDMRKLELNTVAAVLLESGEHVGFWPSYQAQPPVLLLDDLRIAKTAPGPESLPVQTAESLAMMEAREASAAGANADAGLIQRLVAGLKSPDDLVKLNAARAFSRLVSPLAEPALQELVRSLDTRICEAAVDALAHQGTDVAWAALKRAVEIGPFDFTRCFAARALRAKPDIKNVGTLSLMLTARSWRGRRWAAESIGVMANEPQQMVLMAFLHEVDPAVRVAATRAANPKNEEVCKRFLWSAVNDPSDELRAVSCFKLVQSGIAKYVNEGLKGVRDESVGMRRRFLQLIQGAPSEVFRPALRLAVIDAAPSVRAEALRAFAKLPGAVAKAELGNAPTDPDPRIKTAMSELRAAKTIDGA